MRLLSIAMIMASLLLVACSEGESTPESSPTPALRPTAVFAKVSPAVAFIETPAGTGSGVLFKDGYIATNAHVVWPYMEARVVFPDGSEYIDAPVLGMDLLGDLAVIGPIDTGIDHLPFVDGEDIEIGSEVFLIGYPMESEEFPQPAISQGILSRIREWVPNEMTYLQTSADIDFGQSGGVLVSQSGDVIGISGYGLGEAFALAASANDFPARLEGIIDGDDVDGLGDRTLRMEGGLLEYEVELDTIWDQKMFIVNEPKGTEIEIEVTSDNDAVLWLTDLAGELLLEVDSGFSGTESAFARTEYEEPHFFTLGQYSEFPGTFNITSSHNLIPFEDPDDGTSISVGDTIAGSLDYPGDYDWFELHLDAGETVRIAVDSLLIDPYLDVDFLEAFQDEVVSDDDSGGGIFGINAALTYEAPQTGDYFLVVSGAYDAYSGGYYISVISGE